MQKPHVHHQDAQYAQKYQACHCEGSHQGADTIAIIPNPSQQAKKAGHKRMLGENKQTSSLLNTQPRLNRWGGTLQDPTAHELQHRGAQDKIPETKLMHRKQRSESISFNTGLPGLLTAPDSGGLALLLQSILSCLALASSVHPQPPQRMLLRKKSDGCLFHALCGRRAH